jgi:hypothetical protein
MMYDFRGKLMEHRATPSHLPFLIGIFHEINHPAIKGYPHDYGNLQMMIDE